MNSRCQGNDAVLLYDNGRQRQRDTQEQADAYRGRDSKTYGDTSIEKLTKRHCCAFISFQNPLLKSSMYSNIYSYILHI